MSSDYWGYGRTASRRRRAGLRCAPGSLPASFAQRTHFGLYALQHCGQESAGIAISDGKRTSGLPRHGPVSQVRFGPRLAALGVRPLALGQCPRRRVRLRENAQPEFVGRGEGERRRRPQRQPGEREVPCKKSCLEEGFRFNSTDTTPSRRRRRGRVGVPSGRRSGRRCAGLTGLLGGNDRVPWPSATSRLPSPAIGRWTWRLRGSSETCGLTSSVLRTCSATSSPVVGHRRFGASRATAPREPVRRRASEYAYFARPDSPLPTVAGRRQPPPDGREVRREAPVEADVSSYRSPTRDEMAAVGTLRQAASLTRGPATGDVIQRGGRARQNEGSICNTSRRRAVVR